MYKFTKKAEKVLEFSNKIAKEFAHNYIGTEHLLYGLVRENTGVACNILKNQGITVEKIRQEIEILVGRCEEKIENTIGFTPRTKRVLENAYKESKKIGIEYIGTEQILIGIMRETDSIAFRILMDLNVSSQKIFNEIMKITNGEDTKGSNATENVYGSYSSTTTLNQYSVDLTKKAIEGKLEPVIGRNKEIERIVQILSRKTKNNPCLIGEPGVGKTAVIEALAIKIIEDDVPELLKKKRIVTLDISGMVAGAKYRGDFEDRIKKCLKDVKKAGDIILFIDEIHTIVGAGAAEGAVDAANILKPQLARGEIQVVGATTINEYRKYIEKDSALERRFSPVTVEEPSEEETIDIIKGIKDKYESHHGVKITDEAIDTAVRLSVRYINDRFLPDKAIDLIDEAASRVKIKIFTRPQKLKILEEDVEEMEQNKNEAIKSQDFERAVVLRDELKKKMENLEMEKEKWKNKNNSKVVNLSSEDIAEVVAKWTGIPVKQMRKEENDKLKNIEENLKRRVVGQDEAIEAVSKAIKRSRVGLRDPKRPIGSFLFLGPTGVGKTELSKALAQELFGREDAMIRLDMSEYMESHSVSKLIGSPPGYVGYDEGGQLTEKIRRKPYSIILFDEIEKAHPEVMNILLQILEDGRLTDSTGRSVDFRNVVIIMTSNIGAREITEKKSLGFIENNDNSKENEDIRKNVIAELKKELKPEFINRIDEIIVFHKLDETHIEKIIDIMIKDVLERLESKHIKIEISPEVKKLIAQKGTDTQYGARPLRREIQRLIEDNIAEKIVNGEIISHKEFKMIVKDNKIEVV